MLKYKIQCSVGDYLEEHPIETEQVYGKVYKERHQ